MKRLVLLLALLIACAPVETQISETEVPERIIEEKVVVQCWDDSTADSIESCPPQEEVLSSEKIVVEVQTSEQSSVPIAQQFLDGARSKFKGFAYLLDDRLVIEYDNKVRHLFLKMSELDDRTPITDVYVDLDAKKAVAYCHVEREGRDIVGESFDWDRSRCKDYVDKEISVDYAKWVPKGPIEYLEDYAQLEPILVENNFQTISIGGNSKTVQPSIHYMVGGKRHILRIDKRYQIPIKIEIEGQQAIDFRDAFFDVMVLYGKQQKIDASWVAYQPVSEYWKAAASK